MTKSRVSLLNLMNEIEIRILFENAIIDNDFERVDDLIQKYDKCFDDGGSDFAFRLALNLNNEDYIRYSIDKINLNDAGEYSTYFDETNDETIKEILFDSGAEYPN